MATSHRTTTQASHETRLSETLSSTIAIPLLLEQASFIFLLHLQVNRPPTATRSNSSPSRHNRLFVF
jgi:hypothetical protein